MAEPWMDERAIEYAKRTGFSLDLTKKLGYGTDGTVWRTNRNTAIKAFERQATYRTEKRCYLRLRDRNVSEILGFTVPQLEGFDDELLIVEMSIVSPPFVLDFGKAYLDTKPDYTEEVLADDEAYRREMFGEDWPTVERILGYLRSLGIYYVDARPGNITFR
jgi:hypothetical protein